MLPLTTPRQPLEVSLERLGQSMSLYVPLSKGTQRAFPHAWAFCPMFDELRALADKHAELHADRARLAAELDQARRPWRRLVRL